MDNQSKFSEVVSKAWSDPNFKKRLMSNPRETLQAAGIKVPPGIRISIVENTDDNVTIVLPRKPSGELSDAQLDQISAGGGRTGREDPTIRTCSMAPTCW